MNKETIKNVLINEISSELKVAPKMSMNTPPSRGWEFPRCRH